MIARHVAIAPALRRGFTLTEVLIVAAILSILAGWF